jgi:hypothetical protein
MGIPVAGNMCDIQVFKWDDVKWAYSGSFCWIIGPYVREVDLSPISQDCVIAIGDAIRKVFEYGSTGDNTMWHFEDFGAYKRNQDRLSAWGTWSIITCEENIPIIEESKENSRRIVLSYPFLHMKRFDTQYATACQAALWLGFRTFFILGIKNTQKIKNAIEGLKVECQYSKLYCCDRRLPHCETLEFPEALARREII